MDPVRNGQGTSTPIGAIVGGVVGGIGVIAIAAGATFYLRRRKQQPSQQGIAVSELGPDSGPRRVEWKPAKVYHEMSVQGPASEMDSNDGTPPLRMTPQLRELEGNYVR